MPSELPVVRLAVRCRIPVAVAGVVSAVLGIANLLSPIVSDALAQSVALAVGVAAAVMFLSATFDPRFHRAISAINAERRAQARALGWQARLLGWGLPTGDPLLVAVCLLLAAEILVSVSFAHHFPSAILGLAAFFLAGMTSIALSVGGRAAGPSAGQAA